MTNRLQRITPDELRVLSELERKVLWLASWTIHHANHLRESTDGLKVGGHQPSSASLATIMTALYFRTLRPEDRVAVKPHASPNFHAIQYLLGRQTQENFANWGYKGAQSYPSRRCCHDDDTGKSIGAAIGQPDVGHLLRRAAFGASNQLQHWSRDCYLLGIAMDRLSSSFTIMGAAPSLRP
jgi:pyruvate dehydrogenase complex dehydrogenase (E1) component